MKSLLKPFRDGHPLILALLLLLLTAGTFWPLFRNGFVNYDDPTYIYRNPHVLSGLAWDNLRWAFTTLQGGFWHPITWLSIMTDCQLFGQAAWGHHLTSLVLHAGNTLLLFFLLLQLSSAIPSFHHSIIPSPPWPAFFVAAFFAVHPLHVESVAWAAERKDTLSTLFFLLTVLAYSNCVASGEGRWSEFKVQGSKFKVQGFLLIRQFQRPLLWYLSALLLFTLGLMCKTMLVTLPLVLLLLDFWPLNRVQSPSTFAKASADKKSKVQGFDPPAPESQLKVQGSRLKVQSSCSEPRWRGGQWSVVSGLVLEKLPFFALSFAAGIVTIIAQKQAGALQTGARYSVLYRFENAIHSYLEYLFQTVWPARLAVFYSYPKTFSLLLTIAFGLVGLLLTIAAFWILFKVQGSRFKVQGSPLAYDRGLWTAVCGPWSAVGWLWYIITLLPVIGLLQVGAQAHADRYTYIPLIGIFIAVVWTFAEFKVRGSRFKVQGSAGPQHPSAHRVSPFPFYVSRFTPGALAVAALSVCCVLSRGQVQVWHDTFRLYGHAIAVTRDNALAHQNLAAELNQKAVSFRLLLPKTLAPAEQARLRSQISQLEDDAIREYQAAVDADPDYALAHGNLGLALFRKGRLNESIYHSEQAVKLMPNFAGAHRNLGIALGTAGRVDDAIDQLRIAVDLAPTDLSARENLAYALLTKGRTNDANAQLAIVARLRQGR
ncbi:MAG: hypothetical protein C5B50_14780 [Verrucomicrobia bacterium]|nr:MAG: hypothetical protein C5B50_14780 [Verrucomicrobiota bacterium]